MNRGEPGTQLITTTDAAVGTSGQPCRVFSVGLLSDGTAGVLILRNGTSTGDTAVLQIDGTINKMSTPIDFANGVLFPRGCYMDADAHCTGGFISYINEL
jgi:hypothetical protein